MSSDKSKRKADRRNGRHSQHPQNSGQFPAQEDIYNIQVNFQNFGKKYPAQQRQTTYTSQKGSSRQYGKGLKNIDDGQGYQNQGNDSLSNYNQRDENNYTYVERRLNDFQENTSADRENLRKELEGKIDKVKEYLDTELKDKASTSTMRWIFGIFITGFIAMFGLTLNRCTETDKEVKEIQIEVMELRHDQQSTTKQVEKLQMSVDDMKKQNATTISTIVK